MNDVFTGEKYCRIDESHVGGNAYTHDFVDWLCEALREEEAESERLRQWVSDCQSGMYINCVYCGHRYGPKEDTPVAMADVLKEHIEQCPEHPMSHLLAAVEAMLEDYEEGKTHPTFEVREMCRKALTKARGQDY